MTTKRVAACVERLAELGDVDEDGNLSDAALQELLDWLVVTYAARVESVRWEEADPPPPFPPSGSVTETDALVTARQLLEWFELAPFELAMMRP